MLFCKAVSQQLLDAGMIEEWKDCNVKMFRVKYSKKYMGSRQNRASDKGKTISFITYNASYEGKAAHARAYAKYEASVEGKAVGATYHASET